MAVIISELNHETRYNLSLTVKYLRQFITLFGQPAQIWTSDGRVLLANAAFNQLFGLPAGFDWEPLNFSFLEDDQVRLAGATGLMERALNGHPAEIHSLDYLPSRNALLPEARHEPLKLVVSLQPILNQEGLECIICVVSDYMSGGELMDKQLIRSQKMENLETLANGIAHEFNNLLTGIKGMTSLIMDEVEPGSDVHNFAGAIDTNIERGANLINQLLSYSREMPYKLKPTEFVPYIHDIQPMLQLQLTKRIRLVLRVLAGAQVMLDRHRMDQVLSSLMLNARNAMGNNGQILVTVSRRSPQSPEEDSLESDWLCVSIEDSGPGIRPELYERIFEPFFSTSQKSTASGLGLSVANKIIKLHNGIMQAGASEELGGALMRFYLPALQEEHSANAGT